MAEITASSSKKKNGSFSRSVNHRSTRVDLTPMVDLGFLLITFFVFTTSMAMPKAMDLVETHDGKPKPVKRSGAMTIILGKDHAIYYYYGSLEHGASQVNKTDLHTIRSLIVDKKRKTDPHYLMYIIKADKSSTFGDSIDLLDEMTICNITGGNYCEADITEEESAIIKSRTACTRGGLIM